MNAHGQQTPDPFACRACGVPEDTCQASAQPCCIVCAEFNVSPHVTASLASTNKRQRDVPAAAVVLKPGRNAETNSDRRSSMASTLRDVLCRTIGCRSPLANAGLQWPHRVMCTRLHR